MGLVSFFAGLIEFLFNKFTILLIFIALVIAGAVVSRSSKNKDHEVTERSEAEQMRHYVSGINDDPWNGKAGGDAQTKAADGKSKGKLESFYDGQTSGEAIPERLFTKRKRTYWKERNFQRNLIKEKRSKRAEAHELSIPLIAALNYVHMQALSAEIVYIDFPPRNRYAVIKRDFQGMV